MTFPLPFTATEYGASIVSEVISVNMLLWSHLFTAAIGIVFAYFIYRHTKKLSAFYLLLISILFALWSYFELITWGAPAKDMMFTWSVLDVFSIIFMVLTFWFYFALVKGSDMSPRYKIMTLIPTIPIFVYTLMSWNLNTYSNTEINAVESSLTTNYSDITGLLFFLVIIIYAIGAYRKTKDFTTRKKIVLGALGVSVFLGIFVFSFIVTNAMLTFGIGTENDAYAVGSYSLFGMPFLVGILGYLIAKYQAFDLKLTRSIGYILLLMLLLFISIFI
jgi:hypothetical protein